VSELPSGLFPPGWERILSDRETVASLLKAFQELKGAGEFLPDRYDILRAFQVTDYDDVQVVILGRAPSIIPGVANGLAFGAKNRVEQKPATLLNILKEVEMSMKVTLDVSQSSLLGWAEQGVFLLNEILTAEPNQLYRHNSIGWQPFTARVIAALGQRDRPIVFMLWGPFSCYRRLIGPQHLVLEASGPSTREAANSGFGQSFVGCNHFSKANAWLVKQGRKPIDWSRTG